MRFSARRRWRAAVAAAGLSAASALACDGGSSTDPGGAVASVSISPPSPFVVALGGTLELTAVALGPQGTALPDQPIFWASKDADIASVSSTGVLTGKAIGSTQIVASAGGKSAIASVTVSPKTVAEVRVSPTAPHLEVGGTLQLQAATYDAFGEQLPDRPVAWFSTNEQVATVSSGGLVTAVGPGSATIRAISEGKTATSEVSVSVAPVASVDVTPASVDLVLGGEAQLTATPRDARGNPLTGREVSWSSDIPALVGVSAGGKVTGRGEGTTTVTATVDGKTGRATVTVRRVPVASVSVTPGTVTVAVGSTVQLTATPRDAAGAPVPDRTVVWTSSDNAIAPVSQSGVVTAVAAGTATITATSDGRSGTATVTVTPVPVASVDVSPSSVDLLVGEEAQLTATPRDAGGAPLSARQIIWSSSNPGVAEVSPSGRVTARGPGTATITATSEGKTATAAVTVRPVPVASVVVTPPTATLLPGGTVQLQATPTDARGNALSGRAVTWSSSDESVAVVSGSGLVTARTPGTATIVATSEGRTGTAVITVGRLAVASVDVSPTVASVVAGSTVQLSATPRDAAGNALPDRTVVWASSDNSIAPVSQSGVVTGIRAGSVTITASSEGRSGSATVTVVSAPVASVSISPSHVDLRVTEQAQLTATARDASGNTLSGRAATWSSDRPSVADVSQSGLVTARGVGTATITATIEGRSATASVTVTAAPVASVSVTPPSAALFVPGDAVQLTATPRDAQGNALPGRAVVWSSTNGSVASVSSTGLVTPVGVGTARIIATSEDRSGFADITVSPAPVATVSVSPSTAEVVVGSTVQLTAQPKDATGRNLDRPVSWSSSNQAVATVSQSGVVTGVTPGTATISATSEGKIGQATVTVKAPAPAAVASVTVSPSALVLLVGDRDGVAATLRDAAGNVLSGRSVIWSSSNPSVVSIDQEGRVLATGEGVADVIATSEGKEGRATITVYIQVPVASVSVSPSSATLVPGETRQLTVELRDAWNVVIPDRPVTWRSSDESIARVSETGLVTAVQPGSAPVTITATSEGVSGTSSITVIPAPVETVEVVPSSLVLELDDDDDDEFRLAAIPRDARGNALIGRPVTWSSDRPNVADVSPSGRVRARSVGTATVTASSEGKTGLATVTVRR